MLYLCIFVSLWAVACIENICDDILLFFHVHRKYFINKMVFYFTVKYILFFSIKETKFNTLLLFFLKHLILCLNELWINLKSQIIVFFNFLQKNKKNESINIFINFYKNCIIIIIIIINSNINKYKYSGLTFQTNAKILDKYWIFSNGKLFKISASKRFAVIFGLDFIVA